MQLGTNTNGSTVVIVQGTQTTSDLTPHIAAMHDIDSFLAGTLPADATVRLPSLPSLCSPLTLCVCVCVFAGDPDSVHPPHAGGVRIGVQLPRGPV